MRSVMLWVAVGIAGCAQEPSQPAPVAPASLVAASGEAPDDSPRDIQLKRLALAKKLHLKVVDQDGNEVYCRSFMVTGSRIQTETRCLTADQLDHFDQRTQRDLDGVFKSYAPSGPSSLPSPGK